MFICLDWEERGKERHKRIYTCIDIRECAHTHTHFIFRKIRAGSMPTVICTDGPTWLYVKSLHL